MKERTWSQRVWGTEGRSATRVQRLERLLFIRPRASLGIKASKEFRRLVWCLPIRTSQTLT